MHRSLFHLVATTACALTLVSPLHSGLAGSMASASPPDPVPATPSSANAKRTKPTQLSNLSDGLWERQLEVPDTQNLVPDSTVMKEALKTYAKLPFDIGERMRFNVTYMGVNGGTAEVMVRTPVKWGDKDWAHRLTGEVKSAPWYKWITQIHDSVEGLMDSSLELAPLRFYINQQEGAEFRQSKIVNFEQKDAQIRQVTLRKGRELKKSEYPLPRGTKDALGAMYYFRRMVPAEAGTKSFEFPVFTSEKTWTLKAQLQKQETLKVDGQAFDTDVWRITSHFGGLMEQKGDILLWVTRDVRRLPVYGEANVKFGYIKLHLAEWDQGFADRSVKKVFPKIRLDP